MKTIRPARRIASLKGYAFAEVKTRVAKLRAQGYDVIDFGVGDPTVPTPPLVREACKRAVDARAASGYPSYEGSPELRRAIAAWLERRFGVALDPDTEITATIGAKEAVCHFQEAVVDPGDVVLCPSPGYPPYVRGAFLAEGRPHHVPVWRESGMLPDLGRVPDDVARRARLLWFCNPNAPTGRCASLDELAAIHAWAAAHDTVLASDEAYIDFYYDREPPPSMLQVSRDGVIAFFSLSKRSAMTAYRVGFAAGDRRLVELLRTVKTNVDSGVPWFVEDAAAAALGDEAHVASMRDLYHRNRDTLCAALARAGLEPCRPEGAIYVWQRVPEGMTSLEFAQRLLEPPLPIVVTPGSWIAEPLDDGVTNPGEGYVRMALVPPPERVERAAEHIATMALGPR
jgi:LL-diaminopimelate aminotransferase